MDALGSRMRTALLVAATLALTLAATGCAGGPGSGPASGPNGTEGGMGLPVVGWLTDPPVGDTALNGTMLVAENGCFHLDTEQGHLFVVWPDGFEHDGARVRTDQGLPIADGDEVSGTGVVLGAAAATDAGGGRDSQLGSAIRYCAGGADVAVLSEVTTP
jgi:hypothetical protein